MAAKLQMIGALGAAGATTVSATVSAEDDEEFDRLLAASSAGRPSPGEPAAAPASVRARVLQRVTAQLEAEADGSSEPLRMHVVDRAERDEDPAPVIESGWPDSAVPAELHVLMWNAASAGIDLVGWVSVLRVHPLAGPTPGQSPPALFVDLSCAAAGGVVDDAFVDHDRSGKLPAGSARSAVALRSAADLVQSNKVFRRIFADAGTAVTESYLLLVVEWLLAVKVVVVSLLDAALVAWVGAGQRALASHSWAAAEEAQEDFGAHWRQYANLTVNTGFIDSSGLDPIDFLDGLLGPDQADVIRWKMQLFLTSSGDRPLPHLDLRARHTATGRSGFGRTERWKHDRWNRYREGLLLPTGSNSLHARQEQCSDLVRLRAHHYLWVAYRHDNSLLPVSRHSAQPSVIIEPSAIQHLRRVLPPSPSSDESVMLYRNPHRHCSSD